MSDYFSLKQFPHLPTDFAAFFFGFILHCTFLEVALVFFSRATSLEMRYLDLEFYSL